MVGDWELPRLEMIDGVSLAAENCKPDSGVLIGGGAWSPAVHRTLG